MKRVARVGSLLLGAVLATGMPTADRASPASDVPHQNSYVPGLGEFMTSGVQPHHIKLWFAAIARDWKLASYETDELDETFEDIVTFQSEWNGIPIAQLVKTTVMPPLKDISAAIGAKDLVQFRRAYADLVAACNRCHVEAEHDFVKIAIPESNPFSDQRFDRR